MPQVLVFDVGSSFGYFRKAFTTTYALTHAVIPRSTVEGLIGAIIGLSSQEYPERLYSSKIAVEIRSPVRKINMKYMHTNPDWWQEVSLYLRNGEKTGTKRIQFAVPASVEFLVNPIYRIYFDNDQINEKLYTLLMSRQSFYTPYLGTSSMICFTKFVGRYEYRNISRKEHVAINSILPFKDKIPAIRLEKDLKFAIEEGLPVHLDKNRVPAGSYKVLYTPDPSTISVVDSGLAEIEMDVKGAHTHVKFLPTQVTP